MPIRPEKPTARRQSADPLERLDTPAFITRALLKYVPELAGMKVIEPCAGANAMTRVLADEGGCDVAAFDIEPRADGIMRADTLTPGFFEQIAAKYLTPGGNVLADGRQIAVVTNTPFSKAADYWRRTRHFGLVALLVRITWLEKTHNREDVGDPDQIVIVPRTTFTGPGAIDPETGKPLTGGDSATVCWSIWRLDDAWFGRPIIRVGRREKADLERRVLAPTSEPLFTEVGE